MRYDRFVRIGLLALAAALLGAAPAAYQHVLDAAAVDEAITLGLRLSDAERGRFHAPYRLPVSRAPVDYVEVVTPFRDVVLASEEQAAGGQGRLGQREAFALLAVKGDVLELYVELTFHPLNTFVGVPGYDVQLVPSGRSGPAIAPRDVQRIPRFGARIQGAPRPTRTPDALLLTPETQPMLGGTIVVRYDGRLLDVNGVYEVWIRDGATELARPVLDLATLR